MADGGRDESPRVVAVVVEEPRENGRDLGAASGGLSAAAAAAPPEGPTASAAAEGGWPAAAVAGGAAAAVGGSWGLLAAPGSGWDNLSGIHEKLKNDVLESSFFKLL